MFLNEDTDVGRFYDLFYSVTIRERIPIWPPMTPVIKGLALGNSFNLNIEVGKFLKSRNEREEEAIIYYSYHLT